MNFLEALINAIRLPELRNKILFTGGILIVFRLFANIAIPGAKQSALSLLFNQQALLGLLDLFSGGGLSRFSIVAMGMNPYINATIIMQLMTVISERIKEIQKEGEMGRRRIQRWSRYLTVALGAGQAYGFTVLFQNTNPAILGPLDWFQRLQIILVLSAGTVMLMWFGELITEYGIGNGVSLIIFAISVMFLPTIIANYFNAAPPTTWYYRTANWIQGNFTPDTPNLPMAITYNGLYFLFTFGFTYFYTAITFDVNDVADNLKRYSSFIPGIRPGRPTADYLQAVMNRVTFVGAIFLGFITVILPIATSKISGINQQQMYLGGTAILIVVGVALDTMKQLQTQLVMRQYRGFIK